MGDKTDRILETKQSHRVLIERCQKYTARLLVLELRKIAVEVYPAKGIINGRPIR